ncbi:MAG: hypothetical protein AAGA45_05240, partial [Verrucomicrobiota bacterium]
EPQTLQILKADHDNGLLIISRGQKGGLQKQMEFGLVKGLEKPIRVKVSRVENDYAVAHISPGMNHAVDYQEGDEVRVTQ